MNSHIFAIRPDRSVILFAKQFSMTSSILGPMVFGSQCPMVLGPTQGLRPQNRSIQYLSPLTRYTGNYFCKVVQYDHQHIRVDGIWVLVPQGPRPQNRPIVSCSYINLEQTVQRSVSWASQSVRFGNPQGQSGQVSQSVSKVSKHGHWTEWLIYIPLV